MRIYLLPISTRRTLLFAKRLNVVTTDRISLLDKIVERSARMWAGWERRESGWQRRVVDGGNNLLRRIPYQEWGLKTVPPLSARLRDKELHARERGPGSVEVVFPAGVVGRGFGGRNSALLAAAGSGQGQSQDRDRKSQEQWEQKKPERQERQERQGKRDEKLEKKEDKVAEANDQVTQLVTESLKGLGTERMGYHRRMLLWCFVGMPITIPFAIVPLIPNLPFFYLAYRAWSHWRALAGGKHIQFLINNKLLAMRPSATLDQIYKPERLPPPKLLVVNGKKSERDEPILSDAGDNVVAPEERAEEVIMSRERGKAVAAALDLPQLEVELERAVWQVKRVLGDEEQEKKDKQKVQDTEDTEK